MLSRRHSISLQRCPCLSACRREEDCKEAASTDCPSPSSYTTTVFQASPPTITTHPPIAAHTPPLCATGNGSSGSHRAPSPSKVNTSHDKVGLFHVLASKPPKTAKRPSPSTHTLLVKRATLDAGKALHSGCRPAPLGAPWSKEPSISVTPTRILSELPNLS